MGRRRGWPRAWRRHQAGQLIRSVHITLHPLERHTRQTTRKFHAVRDDDGHTVYRPLDEVVQSPLTTEMLRRKMRRRLGGGSGPATKASKSSGYCSSNTRRRARWAGGAGAARLGAAGHGMKRRRRGAAGAGARLVRGVARRQWGRAGRHGRARPAWWLGTAWRGAAGGLG